MAEVSSVVCCCQVLCQVGSMVWLRPHCYHASLNEIFNFPGRNCVVWNCTTRQTSLPMFDNLKIDLTLSQADSHPEMGEALDLWPLLRANDYRPNKNRNNVLQCYNVSDWLNLGNPQPRLEMFWNMASCEVDLPGSCCQTLLIDL